MKAQLSACALCAMALLLAAGCGTGGTTDPPTTGKGIVRGVITDGDGAPIPGATVQLGTSTVSPTATGADGSYTFTGLKIGVTFRVTATYYSSVSGLLTGTSTAFTLTPAATTKTVNLEIEGNSPPGPPPI